ncbi:MAG: glucokinase [Xanthomonadales bacterium]|nr:glucokinase [Xanthomonadales bacterium]
MPPSKGELALIADIGGTNARFALTDLAAADVAIIEPRALAGENFASLQHAAEHYLAEVGVKPRRAALAVASPVDQDEIRLTNRAWSFSRAELQRTLGLDELHMLNDFGAVAWAIPALGAEDRVPLYGPNPAPASGPVSVIGPGTGLGVGLLIGSPERGWQAVETEGGHVTFAPIGDEEHRIARWLEARFGRPSTERVLSGDGLAHIHAALRGTEGGPRDGRSVPLRDPAEIVAAALDGHDIDARRALARFCSVLGSVAGDAALIHGARRVVIAGGIVPRFIPFLRSSAFRERFLAKGRFSTWLEAVTVEIIVHANPGLLGAAVALHQTCRG